MASTKSTTDVDVDEEDPLNTEEEGVDVVSVGIVGAKEDIVAAEVSEVIEAVEKVVTVAGVEEDSEVTVAEAKGHNGCWYI